MNTFYYKYIKYKSKYLQLLNLEQQKLTGGQGVGIVLESNNNNNLICTQFYPIFKNPVTSLPIDESTEYSNKINKIHQYCKTILKKILNYELKTIDLNLENYFNDVKTDIKDRGIQYSDDNYFVEINKTINDIQNIIKTEFNKNDNTINISLLQKLEIYLYILNHLDTILTYKKFTEINSSDNPSTSSSSSISWSEHVISNVLQQTTFKRWKNSHTSHTIPVHLNHDITGLCRYHVMKNMYIHIHKEQKIDYYDEKFFRDFIQKATMRNWIASTDKETFKNEYNTFAISVNTTHNIDWTNVIVRGRPYRAKQNDVKETYVIDTESYNIIQKWKDGSSESLYICGYGSNHWILYILTKDKDNKNITMDIYNSDYNIAKEEYVYWKNIIELIINNSKEKISNLINITD